jgi:hypothetical protein
MADFSDVVELALMLPTNDKVVESRPSNGVVPLFIFEERGAALRYGDLDGGAVLLTGSAPTCILDAGVSL